MFDHQLTIRVTGPGDEHTLRRLADLDSQPHLRARALLAEVDGEPVAAIGLDTATVVANPFRPTANVVTLLEAQHEALAVTAPVATGRWSALLRALRLARPAYEMA